MILKLIKLKRARLCGTLILLWACNGVLAREKFTDDSSATLMRQAITAENQGRNFVAAAAYEELLRRDIGFEVTLAPRLVNLYSKMQQPAKTLAWARRVANNHPQPAAYLAGIYTQLGQHRDAALLLSQALQKKPDSQQRFTLLWQLASAQEALNEKRSAIKTLIMAQLTTNHADRRQRCKRRIATLQKQITTTQISAHPQAETGQQEDQP
jgi:lipopolysaccharide biosynthesis regulator YciM